MSKIKLSFALAVYVVLMTTSQLAYSQNHAELPKKKVHSVEVPVTESDDTADDDAGGTSSKESPAKESPTKESSTQDSTAKGSSTKDSNGEDSTAREESNETKTHRRHKSGQPRAQQKDENGDTYNFYFQKAPGKNNVEQGSGKQKVEPQRESDEYDRGAKSLPPHKSSIESASSFEIHAGLFESPKAAGLGVYAGGEFHVSSLLGIEANVVRMAYSAGDSTSSFSASGTNDTDQTGSAFGGLVALTLSPVASQDFRISGLAGVLVLNESTTSTTHSFSAFGSNDTSSSSSKLDVLPMLGAQATFYTSQNFGIQGRLIVPLDFKYAQVGLGAVFRL